MTLPTDHNIRAVMTGAIGATYLRELIAMAQSKLGCQVDGLWGPETQGALFKRINLEPTPADIPVQMRFLGHLIALEGMGEDLAAGNNRGLNIQTWIKAAGVGQLGEAWCCLPHCVAIIETYGGKERVPFALSSNAKKLGDNIEKAGGVVLKLPEPGAIGIKHRGLLDTQGHIFAFSRYDHDTDLAWIVQGNIGIPPAKVHEAELKAGAWRDKIHKMLRLPRG